MLTQSHVSSVGFVLVGLTHFMGVMPCNADIQPDNTVGTQVSNNAQEQVYQISGGSSIDRNLLHSFLNFSVETGWTAQFQLPSNTNILNIIARVTGADVSNINGTLVIDNLGTPVSLFLINPNGIIFGPDADLNLSGSFIASTAESVAFSSGYRFSAKDPAALSPVLTLGVPVGLQFGSNPAPIVGQFTEPGSGLLLASENQTLALVGGDVSLQGNPFAPYPSNIPSTIAAFDGRVEIASIGEGATVGLTSPNAQQSWALDFSGVQAFKDIEIGNSLIVGGNFSDIFLQGRQIRLSGNTQVSGPIVSELGRGLVSINASELLELNDSNISPVTSSAIAPGDIKIQTKNLFLKNSIINAGTDAEEANNIDQGGSITIQSDQIFLDQSSTISTSSISSALAGKIQINTNSLILNQSSRILSSAFATGSAGTLKIFARSILLDHNSSIKATSVSGMGGDISLAVSDALLLRSQSNISTSSTTTGNGGSINILAGVIAAIPTEDSNISTNAVFGNGGNIKITTQGLFGIFPNTANFPNSSDITARSEFGINGTIDTSIVSTTPLTDLASLPAVLGQKILKTACFTTRSGSNRDSFIYSGRGGLPNTPSDPDQNLAIWQDFRTVPSLISQGNDRHSIPSTASQSIPTAPPIIEAQGFSFKPDGSVMLVAAQSTSPPPSQTCASAHPTSPSSPAPASGS
jgi:filamentous hemagglutinin family protein